MILTPFINIVQSHQQIYTGVPDKRIPCIKPKDWFNKKNIFHIVYLTRNCEVI